MEPRADDTRLQGRTGAPSSEVIDRYLTGDATEGEQRLVREWCETSGVHDALVAELPRVLRAMREDPALTVPDIEIARRTELIFSQDARTAIRESGRMHRMRPVVPGQNRILRRVVWAASAVTAAVAVFVIARLGTTHHSGTGRERAYVTGVGQTAVLTLDDGTRVSLAPSTTLRVGTFASARTVALDGEAYFDVAHTTGVPFQVRTGAFTTQVLGTEFLVRNRTTDIGVHVAVASGKVRIIGGAAPRTGVTLVAGRAGDVTDSVVRVNATDDMTDGAERQHDHFVFRHAPVTQVLRTLGRWYGYQFRCADSALSRQSVTIVLSTQSSSAALASLEDILGVNLTVAGDTVTLTPQSERRGGRTPRVRTYNVWTPIREVGR